DDPNCFSFQELFPGGFTPQMGGTATDASLVAGVRGSTAGGFNWDLSGSAGLHRTDLFIHDTVNASLGPASPTSFDIGANRQREVNLHFDVSYAVSDRVNLAAGTEWRDEQYRLVQGDRDGWLVGPYARQRFMSGANGFFGYGPQQSGTWSRYNVAAYGDLEVSGADGAWTLGTAVRIENFEDFGTTTNGKVSGRFRFVRASLSSGFRAPTPGQQNGFNISSWFDPTVGDLVNNAVIPSISPAAQLRGGLPLGPERSVNYTAGVVFDTGPFTLTADYFRVDVADRIGITSNFLLTDAEIASLVAGGFDAAESVRNFRFFTNAFATMSQGIDVVSTWTPLALRGNTVVSAVFNYTDTRVTDNRRGLLDGRRLAEYAYSLPRTRGNVGVTQRMGRARLLGRLSHYGGWYDYDSGRGEIFLPSGGLAQGFFDGRPILDLEVSFDLGRGTTLAAGGQNVFDTYSQVSTLANWVGEQYSEYTPWGYSGAYYYVRIGYGWGN
ncbi:MAG: TonB-dependent receptor, partial [Acidobacteria bacterium]|nr:TonB-dependent receptor [Acidobacteriota bacterium]